MGRGLFVGVGVGSYANGVHAALGHAVDEVVDLAGLVSGWLDGEPLLDPSEEDVRACLRALPELPGGGPLVLAWSGHGVSSPVGLRLLTTESGTNPMAGLPVAEVVGPCAESGASQVLVVLDTCFSGAGVTAASEVAAAVLAARPPEGRVWVGVLASARPWETARDGEFGRRLVRLIREGPAELALRRPWSVQNRFLRGEDIGDALLREWDTDEQHLSFRRDGISDWLLPNPLYEEGAPAQVVEHLLRAARSGGPAEELSWFTGRTGEVRTVVSWVRSGAPGLRVVTGSAGTGKSAVTGRVVSAAEPAERDRLLEQGPLGHADPGEGAVHAHAYLRGLTLGQAAAGIDRGLVGGKLLARDPDGDRNAALLVGALQRRADSGQAPAVIVVDGLDEARGQAFTIARELLARLAAHAVVVVSTRDLLEPDQDVPTTLVQALQPVEVLDLDDPRWAKSGRAARHDYLVARLAGVDPRMDPAAVAAYLTKTSASTDQQPFLLARLVADQLTANPVDTTVPGWRAGVAGSIFAAIDAELDVLPAPPHRDLPPQVAAALGRRMLAALTWGLGTGFPEAEWTTAAGALVADLPVGDLDARDVSWVLEHLGRFIVQDGQFGTATYRVAHQSLADHLRPPFAPTADTLFAPAAQPIAAALLARYNTLIAAGIPAPSPGYLWHYAGRHAALAGPAGLALLRQLAQTAPELRDEVADAALDVADTLGDWGRPFDALPLTQEAADVFRDLAADNPAHRPDLARALTSLGTRLAAVGRPADALLPADEAADLYRDLAADNPAHRPSLARALGNLGVRLAEVGRPADALSATEEAVDLHRELAADHPEHLPYVAGSLNNLGIVLAEVGRPTEAVPAADEAVDLYRGLAADSPAHLPGLARAFTNLGIWLAQTGRPSDALPPAREAVDLYRELAADNPAHLPDLAGALTNLGARFAAVGRPADALPPTEEAVGLHRELAADNPAHLPNLARALGNLGTRLAAVGRPAEALPPAQEAVDLHRDLAADNPAHRPDLAGALTNLGIRLAAVGRPSDALRPAREAVDLFRELAADNRAHRPDLAAAQNNLGARLAEVGRPAEALPPAREAVDLYRELTADNPAHRPSLAGALTNLGTRLAEVGLLDDALPAADEAVDLYRDLAADNPAHRPNLARALGNLGARLAEVGRPAEALPPADEAVDLFRELAAENPAHRPNLALALTNLGTRVAEVGRPADALPATQEAVDLYRGLAANNPAQLPMLAGALGDLERWLAAAGAAEGRASAAWLSTLHALDGHDRAVLVLHRSLHSPAGTPEAAAWLSDALAAVGDDGPLQAALRDEVRRHASAAGEAFSDAWRHHTGDQLPPWAALAPDAVQAARAWTRTPSYTAEHDFLQAHPELLDPAADPAVEEALLGLPVEEQDRYRRLRAEARQVGFAAAYRPALLAELASTFAAANLPEKQQLLADRATDLTDPQTRDHIAAIAQESQDPQAQTALALVDLATDAAHADVLDTALARLLGRESLTDLIRSTARAADTRPLHPLCRLARVTATSDEEAATAAFYTAVAETLDGQPDTANDNLAIAVGLSPDSRNAWITELAALGSTRPEVIDLIPALTTTTPHRPGQPTHRSQTKEEPK